MGGTRFQRLMVLAVIAVTLALAAWVGSTLRGARLDLTQGQLYTLSPATLRLLDGTRDDITLTLYFSDQVSAGMPDLRNYAGHVRDTLQELVARSRGHLRMQVVDPAPFTAAEDEAAAAGLQGVPANLSGDSIYLGLVARDRAGKVQTIGFFQPDRERFLEYELARLIAAFARARAPVVGLVTSLPVMPRFDFARGDGVGGWLAVTQLQQSFELRYPQLADAATLRGIDVLVLIHPQGLTPPALFNLDQFVLGGGRLLAFVDPRADTQAQHRAPPVQDGADAPPPDDSSDLSPLLAAWGVGYDRTQFVADAHYALTVGMSDSSAPVRHLAMLGIDGGGLATSDVLTAQLKQINVASSGALLPLKNRTTQVTPLISSSTDAALLDVDQLRTLLDPATLAQGLQPALLPAHRPFVIAARLTGHANTAFLNGNPAAPPRDAAGTAPAAKMSGDINVVVVADTDLLTDLLWVQVQQFFGQPVATPFASNGDFLMNAVEHLSGSNTLLGVRGREPFQRPFIRVAALLRRADERTRHEEHRLEAQLQDTERRLTALQQVRGPAGAGPPVISPNAAQQQEIQRFTQRKLAIRKALRQVKRDLTTDIEALGTTLKLINIFSVPALLTVLLGGAAYMRRRRR